MTSHSARGCIHGSGALRPEMKPDPVLATITSYWAAEGGAREEGAGDDGATRQKRQRDGVLLDGDYAGGLPVGDDSMEDAARRRFSSILTTRAGG